MTSRPPDKSAPVRVPASAGQRLLWLLAHYRDVGAGLNCPVLCTMRGSLDPQHLRGALQDLSFRHEALRTTVVGRGRHLEQVVHPLLEVPLRLVDLTTREHRGEVDEHLRQELSTPLDPASTPVRAVCWTTGPQEHLLCLSVHHLVTDAASCPILFRDLGAAYDGRCGQPGAVPPPPPPFRAFAEEQRRALADGRLEPQLRYWRRQLAKTVVPALPRQEPERPRRSCRSTADLAPWIVDELASLARRHRTTPFTVLLAVYFAQLHQVTGSDDLAVASLFANRAAPYGETVGFLATMLLLRTRVPRLATFSDLVGLTHTAVMGAVRHQETPYQLAGSVPRSPDGARAEDAVFQVISEPLGRMSMGDVEVEALIPEGIDSRFDFEMALVPRGGGYRAVLFSRAGLLPPGYADGFVAGYVTIAASVARAADLPLSRLQG